ncbi:ATP-binding protein [Dermabacteraceae bacterium P13128]
MMSPLSDRDKNRVEQLRNSRSYAEALESVLTTNDRVIARVTDGIYRQPASAIRELIANAYDADATWVSVKTDAPDFTRITVEDNGIGMSPEAVVHLLHNIGGSAKRTDTAADLGISSKGNSALSPKGRKLIGKLGIGIFSVSQLTHSFQIITKTKNDDYRTVVLVNLEQFADESLDGAESEFKAGQYKMWREKTNEKDIHGTTIVLTAIRPQTRQTLRSESLWNAVDNSQDGESGKKPSSKIPLYHIGRSAGRRESGEEEVGRSANLPWSTHESPEAAFKSMVDRVWSHSEGQTTVKISDMFDTYLQMIWSLSLALPLPYVDKGIFEEDLSDDWAGFYGISNDLNGGAKRLEGNSCTATVREVAGLGKAEHIDDEFCVLVDGIQLSRPIKFRNLPTTKHILKKPLVFVGGLREEFTKINRGVSAGPLEFEAYLFWTPKVAPTEHQGVLVRIHGASGTLFDSTFFNYQVSEVVRLRQITCEIFVKQGLEAALNIDRESFNTAHPHTVALTRWLHSAIRQLTTVQKREAQQLRGENRYIAKKNADERRRAIIDLASTWKTDGAGVSPNCKVLTEPPTFEDVNVTEIFDLDEILKEMPDWYGKTSGPGSLHLLESIVDLLTAYDLLNPLPTEEKYRFIADLLAILEADNVGK